MTGTDRRDFVEDLATRIAALLPADAGREFRRGLEQVLGSALGRLDVVSREEFEAQARVLERTRARLEALEAEVTAMEAAARPSPSDGQG